MHINDHCHQPSTSTLNFVEKLASNGIRTSFDFKGAAMFRNNQTDHLAKMNANSIFKTYLKAESLAKSSRKQFEFTLGDEFLQGMDENFNFIACKECGEGKMRQSSFKKELKI